jgi:hypothetical protein
MLHREALLKMMRADDVVVSAALLTVGQSNKDYNFFRVSGIQLPLHCFFRQWPIAMDMDAAAMDAMAMDAAATDAAATDAAATDAAAMDAAATDAAATDAAATDADAAVGMRVAMDAVATDLVSISDGFCYDRQYL